MKEKTLRCKITKAQRYRTQKGKTFFHYNVKRK